MLGDHVSHTRRALTSLASLGRPAGARGFTLLEVMTVVVIIAIFTAAALPSFFERMRDRRANQAAQEVAMFYRSAKARAVGRGAAQLVHYDTARPQGQLVLYEAIQAPQGTVGASAQNGSSINSGNCGPLPQAYASCLTTTWTVGPAVDNPQLQPGPSRQVSFWPAQANADFQLLLTLSSPVTTGGTVVSTPDVCFTPGGRTYTRSGAGVPFTALTQVLSLTVQRTTDTTNTNRVGIPRQILVPPSGEARLFL